MDDKWFYAGESSVYVWTDVAGVRMFCIRSRHGSEGLDLKERGIVGLLGMLKESVAHSQAMGTPVAEYMRTSIDVLEQAVAEYGLAPA
jgi:hypothetical protein